MSRYRDPRHFLFDEPVFNVLRNAYAEDLFRAGELEPYRETDGAAIYVLPDAAWSRRVNGLFGNRLAQADPKRAHAVLVTKPGGYSVGLRTPVEKPRGAGALCEQFEGGGGREGAAGIDTLSERDFDRFVEALERAFSGA
jgi:hypothetical protein